MNAWRFTWWTHAWACERVSYSASFAFGSEMAVDAFSVAVADLAGGAVIATGDPVDLERLATQATRVVVADIN